MPSTNAPLPFSSCSDEGLARWKELAPEIADKIAKKGLLVCKTGLFRLVDPVAMIPTLEALGYSPQWVTLFAIGSLGDIFLWNTVSVEFLHARSGARFPSHGSDLGWFIDRGLTDTSLRNGTLRARLYNQIVKRLGPPGEGQIFDAPLAREAKADAFELSTLSDAIGRWKADR